MILRMLQPGGASQYADPYDDQDQLLAPRSHAKRRVGHIFENDTPFCKRLVLASNLDWEISYQSAPCRAPVYFSFSSLSYLCGQYQLPLKPTASTNLNPRYKQHEKRIPLKCLNPTRVLSGLMLAFDIETTGLEGSKHDVTVVCTEDYHTARDWCLLVLV